MKLRVVPYKRGLRSARLLAQALTKKVGYTVFRGPAKAGFQNLIWGKPANKITNFQAFQKAGLSIPEFTTDRKVALEWLKKSDMMVRRLVASQAGHGCIFVPKGSKELPEGPLYVKYIPKRAEYRAHVAYGEVVRILEKRKRRGSDADPKIQSHERGWIFAQDQVHAPGPVRELATRATGVLGLDFGGVDIIYNEKQNKCYLLEVNSAPGLDGTTPEEYVEAILKKYPLPHRREKSIFPRRHRVPVHLHRRGV